MPDLIVLHPKKDQWHCYYCHEKDKEIAELKEILREIEFADTGGLDGPGYCSICRCRSYHETDCRLGILLKDKP